MSLTKQQLLDLNNSSFPNNNAGAITAEDLRVYNSSSIAAFVDENTYLVDSASFSTRINQATNEGQFVTTSSFNAYTASNDAKWTALGSQSGSWVTAAVTASSLVTASFNNTSRDLTFTKGDNTQFSVNIPDVSGSTINTGSLLVTASASGNTITFTKGDSSTFNVTVSGGGTVDTSSFITTGSLNGTQFISGNLDFTGSAKIKILTASFVNVGSGQPQLQLAYEPSASALSYFEVSTNLPQYINQAVKVGAISSGSIVGGFVKVMKNPSLVATGTTSSVGLSGLEWVSQASTDYREWFGYNGNPQSDGEKAFLVQRGLHKVAGNGLGFSVANAASYSVGTPIYWDNVNSTGAMTVVRPTSGQVLRLGYIAGIQDDPANPYVREMWYDPFWEEGQTQYLPKISGSVGLINSNLATTGSNTFVGNQTITGVLSISSSATFDLDITGGIQATVSNRVSSSAGVSAMTPNGVTYTSNTSSIVANVAKAQVNHTDTTGAPTTIKTIGISANPSILGGTLSGVTVPSIIVPSASAGQFIAPIQFQHVGAYTDGRVTFTTPISASAGIVGNTSITGSVTISSSAAVDLNIIGTMKVSSSTSNVLISPNSVIVNSLGFYSSNGTENDLVDGTAIGWDVDYPVNIGFNWTNGPALYVNNDPLDSYAAVFGFQDKTNYTDGRVTVLTPLVVDAGTDFYAYGHKQFNYGAFQTNVSKSGSAGVSQSISFEITDTANGVSMVSGSRITFANTGVYSTTFSAQIETSAGADSAWIWLKKNGVNVAESATKVTLANNTAQVMTVNFVNELNSGDYLELAWQNNSGNAVILAQNASGNIPAIPSVILTSTQVR